MCVFSYQCFLKLSTINISDFASEKKKKKCVLQKLIEHTVCAKQDGEKLPTRHEGSQEVLMGRKNLYNPAIALGALSQCVG